MPFDRAESEKGFHMNDDDTTVAEPPANLDALLTQRVVRRTGKALNVAL